MEMYVEKGSFVKKKNLRRTHDKKFIIERFFIGWDDTSNISASSRGNRRVA